MTASPVKKTGIDQLVNARCVIVSVRHAQDQHSPIVLIVMMEDISTVCNAINVIQLVKLVQGL